MIYDPINDLLAFAAANGFRLTKTDVLKIADTNQWGRTSLESDPPNKKNVSVLIYLSNGRPNALFHIYGRTQGRLKWVYAVAERSKTDIQRFKVENQERKIQAEADLQERQERTARGAAAIWHEALKKTPSFHGYLMKKSLPSDCAHVMTGAEASEAWKAVLITDLPYADDEPEIIVPLTDGDGKIWTVQRIRSKPFQGLSTNKILLSGRKKGLFYEVREPETVRAPVIIAEGWATAMSVALCIPSPVGVYMGIDKDNLLPAAREIQRAIGNRHPIVFAGDNDCETEGNPGKTAAEKAAEALHGVVMIPEALDGKTKATDWNDIYQRDKKGIEKAFEALRSKKGTL